MRPQTQESRLPQRGSQSNTSISTTPASTHRRGPSQQQEDEKRPRSQGSATTTSSSSSSSGNGSGSGSGSATLAGRRQSLIRPSPLKTVSSSSRSTTTPTTVKTTTTIPPASTSPRKPVTRQQQNARPTSPKKTDMPPPPLPRHGRSASLRQPLSASSPSSPGGQSVGAKGHIRHRSQIVTSAAPAKKVETPSTSTPTTPRSKASFTTYQQQSSPKKTTVKSSAATTSTAPAELDPSLIPSSLPEVAALQTEVLQLHLFHSSSLQQHAEWQADSEAQLRKKYDTVAQKYHAIVNEEKEWQRKLNGQALGVWFQNIQEHNGRLGFAEQTQLLSQVVQEVTDFTDDVGGRYTLSIQAFENWFRKAQEIRNCRNQLDQDAAADLVVFIDPLSRSWRDELDSLTMKLELCSRQLQSLDILGYGDMERLLHDSTLLRTAKGLDEMLNLMLDEVNSIRKIERDIVTDERCWVSQLTEQLTASVDTTTRGEQGMERGLWRSAFQT